MSHPEDAPPLPPACNAIPEALDGIGVGGPTFEMGSDVSEAVGGLVVMTVGGAVGNAVGVPEYKAEISAVLSTRL